MTLSFIPIERAVLEKLLAGDAPRLVALQRQLAVCTVAAREWTGVGFYTALHVPAAVARVAGRDVTFGDVVGDIPGVVHGVGFLLYIKNGVLDTLEGYTYDEPWPAVTDRFCLRYSCSDGQAGREIPLMLQTAK